MGSSNAADAIQRVLFSAPKVHVYAVPPLVSSKGYAAAQWTASPPIFTASLRAVESATPKPLSSPNVASPSSTPASRPNAGSPTASSGAAEEALTIVISLEDPSSGELFAEAPYNHHSVITPCTDSARFFAIRVVSEGGRKATLGVGFEERSDALDFKIALEDAGKVLGWANAAAGTARPGYSSGNTREAPKRDLGLKEGEMIKINIGSRLNSADKDETIAHSDDTLNGIGWWHIPQRKGALLPPPPSALDLKRRKETREKARLLHALSTSQAAKVDQDVDDNEFGEFQ